MTFTYEKLQIVLLPLRSTAKHQLLDLSIIANAKTWYRSALLRSVFRVIERRRATKEAFPSNISNGKHGIRQGQLPHIGIQ